MACTQYKLFFADQIATPAQLNGFETITVHQEMDMNWTAHLEFPLRTNAQGDWTGEAESYLQPDVRVRIEVRVMSGAYVPLIDGSLVTADYDTHKDPGQSMLRIDVQDDGYLLHRDETVHLYPGITDDVIAQQIFDDSPDIDSTDIDPVDAPADLSNNVTVLRGTQMELLQTLARRQEMHAFVLPGSQPHTSIGCFKSDPGPDEDSGLEPMVLLGSGRNLMNLKLSSASGLPAVYNTSNVSLGDLSVNSSTANLDDISRLGTNPPGGIPVKRFLRPGKSWNVALGRATQGASEQAAYALSADGEVLKDTYPDVLSPYRNVAVLGSNGKLSGMWLIRQVTHTVTRNSYGQTFSLQRNAQSAGTGNSAPAVPKSVF